MVFRLQLLLAVLPSALGLVRPNDVGKLPALGWNSWNAYACDISEEKFLTAAQAVIDLGLQEAGYEYINVDDCWSVEAGRDNVTHQLIPDLTKFPDGINGTAAKIHAMGFKMGIYSSAGLTTCGGYPASLGFEEIDAASWAAWGIDYLKYDNCGVPSNWTDSCTACVPDSTNANDYVNGTCGNTTGLCAAGFDYSTSLTAERYQRMRDALVAQNRTILFSLCDWGQADVQTWGNETGNSWRTTGDITADWARVVEILNENSFELNAVNFWGHNDPDMLEVGNGNLTFTETRSHFAFWAAMKSPLLIGTDLSTISQQNVDILKNQYLLAFNQDDVFGASAIPYKWGTNPDWTFNSTYPAEFWSGASSNGTLVLLLNPDATNATRLASWAEIPELDATASYQVTDAWTDSDLGCLSSGINVTVAGHDTAVLLLKEC